MAMIYSELGKDYINLKDCISLITIIYIGVRVVVYG